MTYREAKTFLDKTRHCRLQLNRILMEIERIRAEMQSPMGGMSSGDKVQTSKTNTNEAKLLRYIALLEKHEAVYLEAKCRYETIIFEAESLIIQMPESRSKDFLLAHYIDGMSELDYGVTNGYMTTGSVYNLKRRAIRQFAESF